MHKLFALFDAIPVSAGLIPVAAGLVIAFAIDLACILRGGNSIFNPVGIVISTVVPNQKGDKGE